jgi:hypothetical protein
MPGFNTVPSVGGGGGQANMAFVASVHMSTYNRTWAQAGTAGYYSMFSINQEQGYVYFVGSGTTTGGPLNRLINVTHPFTSINIIGMTNDMISMYKSKVKSTTVFDNPFGSFVSFPGVHTSSGNFVLPNAALPLVNVVVAGPGGPGGHGEHEGGGGGGGGGGVVKLNAFPATGTTAINIGAAYGGSNGATGTNKTYFGSVWALAGGGGGHSRGHRGGTGANGGGGTHNQPGGAGQTAATAASTGTFTDYTYHGGFAGGNGNPGSNNHHHVQGGGGGAAGAGTQGVGASGAGGNHGGAGHISDIEGSNHSYGSGGGGAEYNTHSPNGYTHQGVGGRAHGGHGSLQGTNHTGGASGVVVVRYYIP